MIRGAFGDGFVYILYFQEHGPADNELGGDVARTMRRLFSAIRSTDGQNIFLQMAAPGSGGFIDRLPEPEALPDWITQDEFDHIVAEFARTGFTGPLNWYRNMDRNWALTASAPSTTIDVPTLFLGGTADPAMALSPRDRVRDVVTGPYHEVLVEGAGHWLQQERPDEVTAALLEFLTGLR